MVSRFTYSQVSPQSLGRQRDSHITMQFEAILLKWDLYKGMIGSGVSVAMEENCHSIAMPSPLGRHIIYLH
jgi:hypothetical protein